MLGQDSSREGEVRNFHFKLVLRALSRIFNRRFWLNQDVLWLEIPVHDVHRVTVLETFEYLSHDALDSLKSQSFDRLELVCYFKL